jgi:molybdate transport repressor ModE-like protein
MEPVVPERMPSVRDLWLGVEVRHLAALDAIAREGSFCGAADRLGYVQSAVSNQISYLERVVGVRLVHRSRGPGRVTLTEAGEVLLRHADGILGRLKAARADVQALAAGHAGHVRIGVDEVAARHVLTPVMEWLAERQSRIVVVRKDVAYEEERLELLERGALDAAFVELPLLGARFEACEVLHDHYVLLVAADDPAARLRRALTLADLSGMNLLVAPFATGSARGIRDTFRTRDVPMGFALQSLVAAGKGAAIVPSLAVGRGGDGIAVIELEHLLPPRVIGLSWLRDRELPAAVETFRMTVDHVTRQPNLAIAA